MPCILSSQGVVIATAMIVSSTALFLAFSRQSSGNQSSQDNPPEKTLRSCLCLDEKKKQRKKKKRVKFAENIKDTKSNGEEYRREQMKKIESTRRREERTKNMDRICRNEIPANRIALYNGILRDRVHKMECSY